MPSVRVCVVESNGDFFVQPAAVAAEKNDSLRIHNLTNEDLVFRIDATSPFGAEQTVLVKKGSKAKIPVSNTAADGPYPYQILMVQSGKKAKGNSDPMLIIDNP